jgi:hypothetical protein
MNTKLLSEKLKKKRKKKNESSEERYMGRQEYIIKMHYKIAGESMAFVLA